MPTIEDTWMLIIAAIANVPTLIVFGMIFACITLSKRLRRLNVPHIIKVIAAIIYAIYSIRISGLFALSEEVLSAESWLDYASRMEFTIGSGRRMENDNITYKSPYCSEIDIRSGDVSRCIIIKPSGGFGACGSWLIDFTTDCSNVMTSKFLFSSRMAEMAIQAALKRPCMIEHLPQCKLSRNIKRVTIRVDGDNSFGSVEIRRGDK